MTRALGVLAVLAVALAAAAPALAVGPPAFARIPGTEVAAAASAATASKATRQERTRSCTKDEPRSKTRAPGPATVGGASRHSAVVACEFPPRSVPQLNLAHATAAALAILG